MIQFKIQLKAGADPKGLALIVAHGKMFKHGHFVWSTGHKVASGGFDPARPGKALKSLLKVADDAVESLTDNGEPINTDTLKARIELLKNRYRWADQTRKDLSVWDGKKVQRFTITDGVNANELEEKLNQEFQKARPDFARLINGMLAGGKNTLFGFWQDIIDGNVKLKNGKRATGAIKQIKENTMNVLKEYQEYAKVALTFDSMNMDFYNRFTAWLEEHGNGGEGYDVNTVGKFVKDLKAVLNLAQANELFDHNRHAHWPVNYQPNEVVIPNKAELLAINALELSGTIDDCRDLFVLAAFLGPRIGDYKQFDPQNLTSEAGVLYFSYVQEKTGQICKIPVHPIAQAIIDKRDGQFPRMIAEQNFRGYVKDITKQAAEKCKSLNDRVVVKVRDGKPEYAKKHEAITPHDARRVFASSLFYGWFNDPMPAAFCMHYTGHKSEKSFRLYIDAKAQEVNQRALEYFNLQPQMKAIPGGL